MEAPIVPDDYEFRLFSSHLEPESIVATYSFKVKYITDRTAEVTLDKRAYAPDEIMTITVKGVSDSQKNRTRF